MKYGKLWTEGFFAATILFLTVIVFTWPLVLNISKAIPKGVEAEATSLCQLFCAEWTGKVLDEGKPYWNAPFFYPYQGAFAWCEPQPFTCVLIWLISKFTGYIFAYNLVIIIYLVGFGLVSYGIARLLTQSRLASLWCGIWLTSGAYSLQQLWSPPLLAVMFPAGCIFFGLMFVKNKKYRFFWAAVLSFILTWGTSKQLGFYLTIILPCVFYPFFSLNRWRRLTIVNSFFAAVVTIVLLSLHSLRQLSYTRAMGFSWILKDIRIVLKLKNLFIPAKGHWLTTHILGWNLYSRDIGFIPMLVIFISICLGIFKFLSLEEHKKKIVIGIILMIAVALFIGWGPKAGLAINGTNYSLYAFLFSKFLILNLIRIPARIAIFATLGIAILSALALAFVRLRINSWRIRLTVTGLFFLFLFAEMWTMPISLVYIDSEVIQHYAVTDWLRKYGKGQPVLELPLAPSLKAGDMKLDTWAMLRMLKHDNPVINGFATFNPTTYIQLKRAMDVDPVGLGRRYISANGGRFVLVHHHQLSSEQNVLFKKALGNNIAYVEADHTVYLLPEVSPSCDIQQFLPIVAKFKKEPSTGKFYSVLLNKFLPQAVLIPPKKDWQIVFIWSDESGIIKTKKCRIYGSVILDKGQNRIFFKLIRFSGKDRYAEAVLISSDGKNYN